MATVAPLAGAWIETIADMYESDEKNVAPLAGAWIETCKQQPQFHHQWVAPLAGAWIETQIENIEQVTRGVAPLAGAWIETIEAFRASTEYQSHPSRVRGLKLRRLTRFWKSRLRRTPRGCVD